MVYRDLNGRAWVAHAWSFLYDRGYHSVLSLLSPCRALWSANVASGSAATTDTRRVVSLVRAVMSKRERAEAQTGLPRDAQLVASVLRSMGVRAYEPRVLHQLLEFMHRHCAEIFQEGGLYAEHAGRSQLECEDVQLAVRLKAAASQSGASALLEWMARERNREDLPPAPTSASVQLPPQRLCLLKVNYQLEPPPRAADEANADAPSAAAANPTSSTLQPAAKRAKAMPISISLGGGGGGEQAADEWE